MLWRDNCERDFLNPARMKQAHSHFMHAQARRLVKNSIIAVEAPDEDMADDDWVDDQEEADEVLARHRRPATAAAGAANSQCCHPIHILQLTASRLQWSACRSEPEATAKPSFTATHWIGGGQLILGRLHVLRGLDRWRKCAAR